MKLLSTSDGYFVGNSAKIAWAKNSYTYILNQKKSTPKSREPGAGTFRLSVEKASTYRDRRFVMRWHMQRKRAIFINTSNQLAKDHKNMTQAPGHV